ncbi:hypothetical protein ACTXT7_009862 [Hymenolepis weldensis]
MDYPMLYKRGGGMSEETQRSAIDIDTQAMEKNNIENDNAAHVNKEFHGKHNPTWHCIVEMQFQKVGSKAVIKNADMTDDMQQKAVDCAQDAMSRYSIEKDVAAHIKKEFDRMFGPTWHCIVGKNFGRCD